MSLPELLPITFNQSLKSNTVSDFSNSAVPDGHAIIFMQNGVMMKKNSDGIFSDADADAYKWRITRYDDAIRMRPRSDGGFYWDTETGAESFEVYTYTPRSGDWLLIGTKGTIAKITNVTLTAGAIEQNTTHALPSNLPQFVELKNRSGLADSVVPADHSLIFMENEYLMEKKTDGSVVPLDLTCKKWDVFNCNSVSSTTFQGTRVSPHSLGGYYYCGSTQETIPIYTYTPTVGDHVLVGKQGSIGKVEGGSSEGAADYSYFADLDSGLYYLKGSSAYIYGPMDHFIYGTAPELVEDSERSGHKCVYFSTDTAMDTGCPLRKHNSIGETISFWAKPTTMSSDSPCISCYQQDADGPAIRLCLTNSDGSTGKIQALTGMNRGVGTEWVDVTLNNTFHHYVVIFDIANNKIQIYMDKVLIHDETFSLPANPVEIYTDGPLYIGGWANYTYHWAWRGYMHHLIVKHDTATSVEIAKWYDMKELTII